MTRRKISIKPACELNANNIGPQRPNKIQYLDTGNLTRNHIDVLQQLNIREQFPSRAQRKVKHGTILYSMVRPVQEHFGYIENPPDDLIVSTGFITIDVKDENINPRFLYYALTQKHITDYLQTIATNNVSAYPTLTPDDVGNLQFDIPQDKLTQDKIAAILSLLDEKLETANSINAELAAIAKTIYNYWFLQYDFPDSHGRPYKSSGGKMIWSPELKRDIPIGWQVKSLGEITDVSTEQLTPLNTPSKEFRHFSIPALDEYGTFALESGNEIKSNKFIIKDSDLLVSKLNPWFSRVVYATNIPDVICSTEFVVWRTSARPIKNYLYMVAKDAPFIGYCSQSATGTSNSHKRVDPTLMMEYKTAYNATVIESFGEVIGSMLEMLAKNNIERGELLSLRNWLHPLLINGNVTVQ